MKVILKKYTITNQNFRMYKNVIINDDVFAQKLLWGRKIDNSFGKIDTNRSIPLT